MQLNILQYNIWDGCKDEERFNQLSTWLTKQDYDVVGFNELKLWTEVEFKDKTKTWGYKYNCFLNVESTHHSIGIVAKTPIEKIKAIQTEPFHHGLLHVKINGIHFIVTHLTPFEYEHRERETEYIANYIASIEGKVIVMGDLNALSPLDKDHYEKMGTVNNMSAKKSLLKAHIREGVINYRPIQTLLDAGLHDLGFSETLDYSMPTKVHDKIINPTYMRIDYILVNTKLLEMNPTVNIIRNQEVDMLSDHYPVQCKMETLSVK